MLRRTAISLAGLVLVAGLSIALPPPAPVLAVTPACTGWTNTYAPPPTIRVGRTLNGTVTSVDTVPFEAYVAHVLPNEWGGSNSTYLQIGALAVKQYGWYWTMHGRSAYHLANGSCYDVRDDSLDQVYVPTSAPSAAQQAAIDATWRITLRKSSLSPPFFAVHYDGQGTTCGTDYWTSRTFLPQHAVAACITDGMSRDQILRLYLQAPSDPDLSIAEVTDLAGQDRYGTSAAVAAFALQATGRVVYVATGLDYPDALAAGPAAAASGGVVLLVTQDAIPASVAAQLARLKPSLIKIAGGESVISSAVQAALAQYVGGDPSRVIRLGGSDRYATAALISADAFPKVPVANVYVATGENFPDALGGAAAAARSGVPVLIVKPDSIPAPVAVELQRLAPQHITVLGGTLVVSDQVQQELAQYVGGDASRVTRIAGADRYATAALLSAATYPAGAPLVVVATGDNFPDALSGSVMGRPTLLVPSAGRPSSVVVDEATRLAPTQGYLVLGTSLVVPDAAIEAFAAPPSPSPTPSPSPSPSPTPSPSPSPSPSASP